MSSLGSENNNNNNINNNNNQISQSNLSSQDYSNNNNDNNNENNNGGLNFSQSAPNKYEVAEIEFIQQEIQNVTKKIEQEKITRRILQERYEKKLGEYNLLEGKPVDLSKEKKQKILKEKMEKMKNRKITDLTERKTKPIAPDEENKKIMKDTNKCEIDLEFINKEINKHILINNNLMKEIENYRKDKNRLNNQLKQVNNENKKIENDIDILLIKNKERVNKIKFKELAKTKEKGNEIKNSFEDKKDKLEDKYHEIIETNIKRERERKKELSNKRIILGMIAENAKKNKSKNITDQIKRLTSDEISDRTPILDILNEKWKVITKYKKIMIDKYIKNSIDITEAFDKMKSLLCIDNYNELPIIYEKMAEQINSIDFYLSKLNDEYYKLENEKNILKEQINKLKQDQFYSIKELENNVENKNNSIKKLEIFNEELLDNIIYKRKFFKKLEEPSFKFLKKVQNTYLSEFIPVKFNINDSTIINEKNVLDILACIKYYINLINDFDKSTNKNKNNDIDNANKINKDLEKLKRDINNKLSKINMENCMHDSFYNNMRLDMKNSSFDYTIKKMANIIANQVNSNIINSYSTRKLKNSSLNSSIKSIKQNNNNINKSYNGGIKSKSMRKSSSVIKLGRKGF